MQLFPIGRQTGNYGVVGLIDERRPTGFAAMGVFLFFGATMASLAAITLLRRGPVLDRAWRLNPTAYQQLAPLGSRISTLFLFLSAALLVAGIGWFLRRRWAWRLTILIIGTQIVGDFVNLVRGDRLRGATGVIIAGALINALPFESKSQSRLWNSTVNSTSQLSKGFIPGIKPSIRASGNRSK